MENKLFRNKNNDRLVGFEIKLNFDVDMFRWIPNAKYRYKKFRMRWLGFELWIAPKYKIF
jgi:hypothetical protein